MPEGREDLSKILWHFYFKDMADLFLNITILPTYDKNTLAIKDISIYPDDPPVVTNPQIEIQVPGYDAVFLNFVPEETNIFNSTDLGITTLGNEEALPDGIYCVKYTIDPPLENCAERSLLRVDQLQEKFDQVFMQLDMMECDQAIRKQSKVELFTVYLFIQGAIAAANNCADVESSKLYVKADRMLTMMLNSDCGYTGVNYMINFY